MKLESELWDESRVRNQYELLGSLIRDEFKREKVVRIDLTYLGDQIDKWWSTRSEKDYSVFNLSALKMLVLDTIKSEHLEDIKSVGFSKSNISAVFLEHTFHIADKSLARLVHEIMSEIAGIIDIKYPYEDHKELFPKDNDKLASDWGRGLGIIRPHSDDLYEDRAINAMALTVLKDTSSTPTWFWLLKDIVHCLTDEELGEFALAKAIFLSGTNVVGQTIEVIKPILRRDPEEGLGMRIDFRIDDTVGARMRFQDDCIQKLFDKMRSSLRNLKPISTNPSTGSVSILSNYKVLHGRSALNPIMLYEGESSRILFRSKGSK